MVFLGYKKNSFHFVRSSLRRMRPGWHSGWRLRRRYLRRHLWHLVVATARGSMLVRRVLMPLVRTGLELRLLLVVAAYRGH